MSVYIRDSPTCTAICLHIYLNYFACLTQNSEIKLTHVAWEACSGATKI